MIRDALSAAARNANLGGVLGRTPIARDVVKRLVGGDTIESALGVAADLADRGFFVSLERAAPGTATLEQADAVAAEYAGLLDAVAASGLAGACEVAVLPEAVGLGIPGADGACWRDRLTGLAEQAARRRVGLMIGMGPADDMAQTVAMAVDLQAAGRDVGVTLPAVMRRTEDDCVRLADHRVRLVKGGHRAEPSVAHTQPIEIDKAFVRAAKTLLRGSGQPSFATHDPRLVEIVEALVGRYGRAPQTYEFAFYMGRLEGTQERLLAQGERVRVYVPYGPDWFERLVGGLAEQPSTVAAALRSLLPGS